MLNFRFYHFKTLGSTMYKAKQFAKKGHSNLVVIADKQTKGKGRFKRKWSSGLGGLYMTISLKVDDISKVKYLTFIAAISVTKTIKILSKLNAQVKWPNDVLVNDKKICGVLTETISGKQNYTFIGIGFNINQKKFPKNITNKITSLFLKTNKKFNIKKISKMVVDEFNNLYKEYNKKRYKKIINEWKKYSHTLGKKVKVKTLSRIYIGKAVDIDQDCDLILELKHNKLKKIVEGDIFHLLVTFK